MHLELLLTPPSQNPEAQIRRAVRGPSGASFVPGMVHEIRNFAFAISASLEAFEARFGSGNAERRYAEIIRARLDRLMAFMAEVKEYGEPMGLQTLDLNLGLLLREACGRAEGLALERGVSLHLDLPPELPLAKGDRATLGRALDALLDLLLRLAPPGASLQGRLESGEGVLRGHLEVRPAGLLGMEAARLMEPFYYKVHGCANLGPATARRTFEAHGGTVSAAETAAGGLGMTFSLPA